MPSLSCTATFLKAVSQHPKWFILWNKDFPYKWFSASVSDLKVFFVFVFLFNLHYCKMSYALPTVNKGCSLLSLAMRSWIYFSTTPFLLLCVGSPWRTPTSKKSLHRRRNGMVARSQSGHRTWKSGEGGVAEEKIVPPRHSAQAGAPQAPPLLCLCSAPPLHLLVGCDCEANLKSTFSFLF